MWILVRLMVLHNSLKISSVFFFSSSSASLTELSPVIHTCVSSSFLLFSLLLKHFYLVTVLCSSAMMFFSYSVLMISFCHLKLFYLFVEILILFIKYALDLGACFYENLRNFSSGKSYNSILLGTVSGNLSCFVCLFVCLKNIFLILPCSPFSVLVSGH